MSEPFDSYRIWLGIPAEQQPPNHYQLLGIGEFESNPDVIENAADRQMSHVRTFQSGEHSDDSQRILNEITQAKLCLLKPDSRAAYEANLRSQQPVNSPSGDQAIPVSPAGGSTVHPGMAPMVSPAAIPVGSSAHSVTPAATAQPQAIPVGRSTSAGQTATPVSPDNPTAQLPGIAGPSAKTVTRRARKHRGNAGMPWILIMGILFGVGSIVAIGVIIMKATGIEAE